MRQRIDYEELAPILALIEKDLLARRSPEISFTHEEKALLDKFTDYLNLFELMAYLKERKQLHDKDINAMFRYYLKRLSEVDETGKVREYIKRSGYEHLEKLLVEMNRGKSAARH